MKTLMLSVVAIVASMVAFADTVTFTWKGGNGNWSDPAMWTASDSSMDKYPCEATDRAVFSPGEKAVVTVTGSVYPYDVRFTPGDSDLCFKGDPDVLPLIKLAKDNKENQGTNENWRLTFDGVKCTFGDSVWGGQTFYPRHNSTLTLKNRAYAALYRFWVSQTTWTNVAVNVESGSTFEIGCFVSAGKDSYVVVSNATINNQGSNFDTSNDFKWYVYGNSKILTRRSFFVNAPTTLNVSLPEEPYESELVKLTNNGVDYTVTYTTINILPDSPALKNPASSNRVYRIFNWAGTKAGSTYGIDPKCLTWTYGGKKLRPYYVRLQFVQDS